MKDDSYLKEEKKKRFKEIMRIYVECYSKLQSKIASSQ